MTTPLGDEGPEAEEALHRVPLADEDDELPPQRLCPAAPLADELSEGDVGSESGSSSSSCSLSHAPELPGSPSWRVVGLGFDTFLTAEEMNLLQRARVQAQLETVKARKRPYSSAKRRARAAARQALLPSKRGHAANGADPARLRRVLKSACRCPRQCFRKLDGRTTQLFVSKYWALCKRDRDSLLSLVSTTSGRGTTTVWEFLGKEMSAECVAKVLGHHSRKLYRQGLHIDHRFQGRMVVGYKLHAELDSFFMTMYLSVAEPLPTKPVPELLVSGANNQSHRVLCERA